MAIKALLQGMGLGAGAMYFWDPDHGRRRRSLVLDQVDHARHCTEDFFDKAQRDFVNRTTGFTAQAQSLLRRDTADDHVITARVRSKIGRYCSHPHAVKVQVQDGHVVLTGPILADEVDDLTCAVGWVRGVRSVENRMDVHQQRGNFSALQGGRHPGGEHLDIWQENWSPATRAIAQLAGLALMGNCLLRRDMTSTLLGTLGLGLFVRGNMNRSLGLLPTAPGGQQPVRLQRTVMIHAPAERVWQFLNDFEQLGRFLPGVRSVEQVADGHYRWGLQLPGGQELTMEERVTQCVPQERLAWESVAGQPIAYSGSVSLQREGDQTTRVNVHLEYTPPGGALGDALAHLLGVDAKSQFQQAVMRAKSYLETGNPPHDLHEVSTGAHAGQME